MEEALVIAEIAAGRVPKNAKVRADGTEAWVRVDSYTPFIRAFQSQPQATPARARRSLASIWAPLAAIAAVCSALMLGVIIWRVIVAETAARTWRAEELSRTNLVLDRIKRFTTPPSWVPASSVQFNCHADNTDVTCSFTNLHGWPVTTCVRGTLAAKEAKGVSLRSTIICTGTLGPTETKTLRGHWVGGFAKDLCNSKSYGTTVLDWTVCEFDTEGVDVPALQRDRGTEAK